MMFVDDYLFIGFKFNEINVIKRKIAKEYIIEDRSLTVYFFRVQIIRDRTKRLLQLFQSYYIKEALKRFGLENFWLVLILLQPGLLKPNSNFINSVQNVENKLYQKIIDIAIYLLTQIRPNIDFSIQWFFRFFQKSLQMYLNVGKNLLKFLGGIEELAICYNYKGLTNDL